MSFEDDFGAAGFEIGETWYLDLDSGEWSQTPPPPDQRRPPGRGVITKIMGTAVTFDASPALPTTEAPGNRRARRAAKTGRARHRRGRRARRASREDAGRDGRARQGHSPEMTAAVGRVEHARLVSVRRDLR